MNKKLFAPAAAAGLLLGSIATASPALADRPGTSSADIVGVARLINATTAEVQVRYSCTEGAPEEMHLWVSVKQSENGTANPELADGGTGFGHQATAWAQTHSLGGNLDCDGRTHVGRFAVQSGPDEFGYGELQRGDAYVQFCMFDATHPFDPNGDPEDPNTVQPISSMEFVHVR